jgi:hypothetical protein
MHFYPFVRIHPIDVLIVRIEYISSVSTAYPGSPETATCLAVLFVKTADGKGSLLLSDKGEQEISMHINSAIQIMLLL